MRKLKYLTVFAIGALVIGGCGYVAERKREAWYEEHGPEMRKLDADVDKGHKIDGVVLGVASFFGGALPAGGLGILDGVKRARRRYLEGERDGVVIMRDALAKAREDEEVNQLFKGRLGEFLDSELPAAILEVVTEEGKHKPVDQESVDA